MKLRFVAIIFLAGGILAAAYFCWALHRISPGVIVAEGQSWPCPAPYPDAWLFHWDQRLEAAHPPPPGAVNYEGQLPRIRWYLMGWIGLSLLVAFGGFWLAFVARETPRKAT